MPNWKKVVVSGSDAILNNITATGDVTVQGDLIAENYIISSSVTHVTQSFSSGSTIFGDTMDDTHQFTGSLFITGNLDITSGSISTPDLNLLGDSSPEIIADGTLTLSASAGVVVSASSLSVEGLLFISASDAIGQPYLNLLIDTSSGQIYYTSSVGPDSDWLIEGNNGNYLINGISSSGDSYKVVIASASSTTPTDLRLLNIIGDNTSTNVADLNTATDSGILIKNPYASGIYPDIYSNIDFRIASLDGRIAFQSQDGGATGDFIFITDAAPGGNKETLKIKGNSDIVVSGSISASLPNATKANVVYYDTSTGGLSYDIGGSGGDDDWYDGTTFISSSVEVLVSGNISIPQGEGYFEGNGEGLYNVPVPLDWDGDITNVNLTKLTQTQYGDSTSIIDANSYPTSSLILTGSSTSGSYPILYFDNPTSLPIPPFAPSTFTNAISKKCICFTSSDAGNQLGSPEFNLLNVFIGIGNPKIIDLAPLATGGNVTGGQLIQAIYDVLKENYSLSWNTLGPKYEFTDIYNVQSLAGDLLRTAFYTPTEVLKRNLFNIDWSSSIANNTTESYSGGGTDGERFYYSSTPNIAYENLRTDLNTIISASFTVSGSITSSGNISASGLLFASTSNASGNPYHTVMVDTASGQFYYTGSYGGGGGGVGDNLGNHLATQTLDMDGENINMNSGEVQNAIGVYTQVVSSATDGDLTVQADGDMIFIIDQDNDETGKTFSFKNDNIEIVSIDESGNITASGDISASGYIYGTRYYSNDLNFAWYDIGNTQGYANGETVFLGSLNTKNTAVQGSSINLGSPGTTTPITASGNLSASGLLFASTSDAGGASYNTLMVDTTTGQFYHTGSYGGGGGGGISTIAVGDGLNVTNPSGPTTTINLDLTEVIATDIANRVLTSDGDGTLTAESSFIHTSTLTTIDQDTQILGVIASAKDNNGTINATGEYGYGAEIWEGPGLSDTSAGRMYYLTSGNTMAAASSGSEAEVSGFIGVGTTGNSSDGLVIRGFVYIGTPVGGGSPGDKVYINTSGTFTTTKPTTSGDFVRLVGHLASSTIVYFNPSNDYIELA